MYVSAIISSFIVTIFIEPIGMIMKMVHINSYVFDAKLQLLLIINFSSNVTKALCKRRNIAEVRHFKRLTNVASG